MHAKESRPLAGAEIPVREEATSPPSADGMSRRAALKTLSAGALLAVAAGCTRKPERRIVSLAEQPEYQKPGIPLHYASTWTEGMWPYGIMVKAVDGRPVKIEGLPDHPLNRGRSSAWMQASLLSLYDPERLRTPLVDGAEATWEAADEKVVEALRGASSVLVLTRSTVGPTERGLLTRFLRVARGVRHLVHEGACDPSVRDALREIHGTDGIPVPDLSRARIVLSLGCDFLGTDGESIGAARDFAARRVVHGDARAADLSRLYVAESAMTTTGSNADHRIPLKPTQLQAFAVALLDAVEGKTPADVPGDRGVFDALVSDLKANPGAAVVLAGERQLPAIHAAAALLNDALGAHGKTVGWNAEPPTLPVDPPGVIADALKEKPDVVLLLGVNPVHDFPGGGFAELLAGAQLSVGHGLTRNETLAACDVALPSAHNLESWNDRTPLPGIDSLVQPLIAPLYGGRQEADSVLTWAKALAPDDAHWKFAADFHDLVKGRWGAILGSSEEAAWEDALRRGLAGKARPVRHPALDKARAEEMARGVPAGVSGPGYELLLAPDPTLYDGRFAGNAWLQELPDPVSRLVWDNAAQVSPATAAKLGIADGDWVTLKVGAKTLEAPALVQPGTAPDTVVLPLGLGRTAGAGTGDGVGFNAASLIGIGNHTFQAAGVQIGITGRASHKLVRTQTSFSQTDEYNRDPRPIALSGTKTEYVADNAFVSKQVHVPDLNRQLHGEFDYTQAPKWEMAIDLSACIGCGACTIACQAENNIAVVGKDECGMGRDMAWIRIDRYEAGDPENPEVTQQPMLCQHCDNAPCENVCPVNATVHGPEGLNQQVYNRCVGTRYCANNCPYKVRRFNYYAYQKNAIEDANQELMYNPQVTVRMRGVMEKCTFCVQRINAAKFAASNAGEEVADGAVVPACQQACPANAIVFGNRNDEKSEIAARRASPLGYRVLEELNVRPNVTYLARVRNPAPGTEAASGEAAHDGEGGHR